MISSRLRERAHRFSCLLPLIAAVFAACDPPEEMPCVQHDNSDLGTRWIGIKTDAASNLTCAKTLAGSTIWTAEALFLDATNAPASGPLGRYCIYEHKTLGSVEEARREAVATSDPTCAAKAVSLKPAMALDQLQTALVPGMVTDLTQDSVVISAQAAQQHALQTVRGYLRERIHEATGGLATDVPPFVANDKSSHYVTTAILDSAPYKADGSGQRAGLVPDIADTNDAHGSLMAFLANDVSCPESDANSTSGQCGVRTHTVLALPLRAPDKEDHTYGGYFGRRSDLARALYQTVVAHRERFNAMKGEEARLVISLSLAWEPNSELDQVCGYNPGPSGKDSASLAVQEVLTFAACHGATVIAAAGNHAGNSAGRMCPADFERVSLPSAGVCGEWATYEKTVNDVTTKASFTEEFQAVFNGGRLGQPDDLKSAPFRPIVYSVGGIVPHGGSSDEPLAPTRPGSRPRFVAIAEGGVSAMRAFSSLPDIDESSRSGTSVAAANLAGIAAGVLATNPALTPPEVMEQLYKTGFHVALPGQTGATGPTGLSGPTGLLVEACSQAPGALCDVTEARRPMLCNAIGGTCYLAPSGGPGFANPAVFMAVANMTIGLATSPATLAPASWAASAQGATSVSAEPWVIEQPVRGGCPDCVWSAGQQEISIINPAWTGAEATVRRLVFTVELPTTSNPNTMDFEADGYTQRITGLPSNARSVTMTAIDTDDFVVTQTIVGVP